MDQRRLERIKNEYIGQIRDRLDHLRCTEEKLNVDIVDPIDIEYQLRHIARRAGVRDRNKFFGIAGFINDNFPPKERKVLYYLLNEIEEGIPSKDVDYHELLSKTRIDSGT